jgi:hypothetical protein
MNCPFCNLDLRAPQNVLFEVAGVRAVGNIGQGGEMRVSEPDWDGAVVSVGNCRRCGEDLRAFLRDSEALFPDPKLPLKEPERLFTITWPDSPKVPAQHLAMQGGTTFEVAAQAAVVMYGKNGDKRLKLACFGKEMTVNLTEPLDRQVFDIVGKTTESENKPVLVCGDCADPKDWAYEGSFTVDPGCSRCGKPLGVFKGRTAYQV